MTKRIKGKEMLKYLNSKECEAACDRITAYYMMMFARLFCNMVNKAREIKDQSMEEEKES